MENFSKHIGGRKITTNELQCLSTEGFDAIEDRAFITLHTFDNGFQNIWFELRLNDKRMKFDDEITMEFCREHFGHLSFGISDGEQATRNHSMRDNL